MSIVFKRGKYCARKNGKQYKFDTEIEAMEFLGIAPKEVVQPEFEWKTKVPFFTKDNDGSSDT